MIVNPTAEGWEIINQRAHGLLAAKIASHWAEYQRPARWFETLLAIAEHDDGREPRRQRYYLNDAGAPRSFAEIDFPEGQARRILRIARQKARWVATLVCRHLIYLYEGKERATAQKFVAEVHKLVAAWRQELDVSAAELEAAYRLMNFCDACSLALCQGQIPPGNRALEVGNAPDGTPLFVRQPTPGTLSVTPWPFQIDDFEVEVEARYLQQLTFESDTALADALDATAPERKRWRFVRPADESD